MTTRWYAVHTNPQKERLAVRALLAQGIDVFWPHYLARVKHGMRLGYTLRSWFPRYVFVSEGTFFSAGAVNDTMGVSTLVYVGDQLLDIPDDIIWDLRSMADPRGLIPASSLGPKDMVKIRGDNLIPAMRQLASLKTRVWAKGVTATVQKVA